MDTADRNILLVVFHEDSFLASCGLLVTLPTRKRDRGLGMALVTKLSRLAVAAKTGAGKTDPHVKASI